MPLPIIMNSREMLSLHTSLLMAIEASDTCVVARFCVDDNYKIKMEVLKKEEK